MPSLPLINNTTSNTPSLSPSNTSYLPGAQASSREEIHEFLQPKQQPELMYLLVDSDADHNKAAQLAHKLPIQVFHYDKDTLPFEASLFLHLTKEGLKLEQGNMVLTCNFKDMLARIKPGKLQTELLVKATKLKNKQPSGLVSTQSDKTQISTESSGISSEYPLQTNTAPTPIVIDATAGLGQDSFLLAAAGFTVHMYEQDPIIAALLQDSLERAKQNKTLAPIASRMYLHEEDSVAALQKLEADTFCRKPDVIYLDPMFPERTKSAAVKKKFQLLHHLEHPCENEEELLSTAMNIRPRKIVVKRMAKGPFLAGKKPSYSIKGKSIRYDCYVYA